MNLEASLGYPLRGDSATVILLIGGGVLLAGGLLGIGGVLLPLVLYLTGLVPFGVGALVLTPVLFVLQLAVTIPVLGYTVRVFRTTVEGANEPPRFDDPGELLVEGLKATAVGIVYIVPLLASIAVGIAVVLASSGLGVAFSEELAAASGLVGSLVGLIFFGVVPAIFGLAVSYVLPAALCAFAREGEMSAAFDVDHLRAVVTDGEYAVSWLVAAAGVLVLNQVAGFLTLVLVGFWLQFYIQVAAARVVAKGYAAAMPVDGDGPVGPVTAEPTTPTDSLRDRW
jgi:hypothetical protein